MGLSFWLFALIMLVGVIASRVVSYWMRRQFPGLYTPRGILLSLALSIVVIVIGLLINPPSEIRKGIGTIWAIQAARRNQTKNHCCAMATTHGRSTLSACDLIGQRHHRQLIVAHAGCGRCVLFRCDAGGQ